MYSYPDFPAKVYVELTNVCNARCTICATPQMKRPREFMSMSLFRKIVDECGRHRAPNLLPFLHGETLLVPGVLDYFRYVRERAPETHLNLTTNGSRLNADLTEEILQEDLLDSMIVSIDGGDKATFERIRLGLSYDQVRSNVLHFIRRRNQMRKTAPTVKIAMVTVEANKHSRKMLRQVWREADGVSFSVYFNWAGQLHNNGRSPNKINYCERLQHYITILADGRVALCCFDSEAQYPVGNLQRQTIHQVWHSEAFNEKRRLLYEKNFERMKLCGACDYINHPQWVTPLARLRPQVHRNFPQLAQTAENLYKRWLTR